MKRVAGLYLCAGLLVYGCAGKTEEQDGEIRTDLPASLELRELDLEQRRELCEDAELASGRHVGPIVRRWCDVLAVLQIEEAVDDADARQQCAARSAECQRELDELRSAPTYCDVEFPDTCEWTVGEWVDCANSMRVVQNQWLGEQVNRESMNVAVIQADEDLIEDYMSALRRAVPECLTELDLCVGLNEP